ncbi:hypothetical protein GGI12_003941 [Dipsacomyces acuminosporus]|nr:hypothetical protein GGI12_003941 [Dipsacomyces acuminosporus]
MDIANVLVKRIPRLSDEQRIKNAKEHGIKLDPVGASDKAMIAVVFTLLGLTAVPIILAWVHRDYRPLKAKNLTNITLLLLSGIGWSVGGMIINSLVPITGAWSNCKLWVIWVRVSFTYMFLFLLFFRTFTLHRIFILNRPCRGWGYYAPVIVYTAFQLIFNSATQVISPEKTIKYLPDLEMCTLDRAYHISCVLPIIALWLIYLVQMFLIRNIRTSFNEFRESLIIFFGASAMVIELVSLHLGVPKFSMYRTVRILCATFDTLCILLPIWTLLGKPLYMCLFRHDEYLEKWLQVLASDGLSKVYKLQEGQEGVSTSSYSRMDSSQQSEKHLTSMTSGNANTTLNSATLVNHFHESILPAPKDRNSQIRFQQNNSRAGRHSRPPANMHSHSEISLTESEPGFTMDSRNIL